jgi:hypothetical protein
MSQQLSLFNNIPVTIINVTGINEKIFYFEKEELEYCDFINGKWYYYEPNLSRIKGVFIINVKLKNERAFVAYKPLKDIIYYPLQFVVRNEYENSNVHNNFFFF